MIQKIGTLFDLALPQKPEKQATVPTIQTPPKTPPKTPPINSFERGNVQYNKPNIKFSQNWNNKLFSKAFTTIRLHSDYKYIIGDLHEVLFVAAKQPQIMLGVAQIVTKQTLLLRELTEFDAHLDTGYNLATTTDIIVKMYKDKGCDFTTQKLDFVLYKYQSVTDAWRNDLQRIEVVR